ncbi:MAG TPA: hypothetical protein PKW33_16885 [Anaerolineaceae bacterium]|nr:hypothetical protein [Anaerolineaceae bacterium]HPN53275.1 hypothetical protein [Anaerolineaceae bacterium]
MRRLHWLSLLLLALCLLAGCAPLNSAAQTARTGLAPLQGGDVLGQTFISRYGGLNSVLVFLSPLPNQPGAGPLRLRLESIDEGRVLYSAALPLDELNAERLYRFDFAPRPEPAGTAYRVVLSLDSGAAAYGVAENQTFTDGGLSLNGQPTANQLTFSLTYDLGGLLLDLARESGGWLLWLLAAGLLLAVPGWGLLGLVWPGFERLDGAEKLALAAGFSMALYPVLLLWLDAIQLKQGAVLVWLLAWLGLLSILWPYLRVRQFPRLPRPDAPALALGVGLLVMLGLRFFVIRLLAAPLWGDSVHHTALAQQMMETGGLFQSWLPRYPYTTLTVQFGFPAAAAAWGWLTGMAPAQAVLVTGQVSSALAALTLYPLALRLWKGNRWAAAGSVLAAGLLSPLPAGFLNWGRYAQLTGQVILPAAAWFTWSLLDDPRLNSRKVIILAVTLVGMLLHYYRMGFYYALFVPVLLLIEWKTWRPRWKTALPALALAAALTLVLTLPWLVRVAGSSLSNAVEGSLTAVTPLEDVLQDLTAWQEAGQYLPPLLLGLAGLGLLAGLLRRRWMTAGLVLWFALLAAVRAGTLINLPAANMMQSFAVIIALYVPLGLLAGGALGEFCAWLAARPARWGQAAALLVMLAAVLYGVSTLRHPPPASFMLVQNPDVRAMNWISANTPAEARFLVEGYRIYGGTSAVGSDAGWWIPIFTGRANTMPPQYLLMNEVPDPADYSQRVVKLAERLETSSPGSPEGLRALCDEHITHVYIGQTQGLTGYGASQLFTQQELAESPAFRPVYGQDQVRIYEFDRSLCTK